MISKITNSGYISVIRQKFSGDGENLPKKKPRERDDDDGESLMSAVDNVANYVQNINREVHFDVDESSGKGSVTVVDSASGRMIRRIPAQEVLEMSRQISNRVTDPIKGLLVRNKV